MAEFKDFQKAITEQFALMQMYPLFKTNVSKDDMWDTYMGSFPAGTNNIYKERREYDCQCCKQFIRAAGNIVAIIDNNLVSIWDVTVPDYYQVVANVMSALIRGARVRDIFLSAEPHLGTFQNVQVVEDGPTITWSHFHIKVPDANQKRGDAIGSLLGEAVSNKNVFMRGIQELPLEVAQTVLELIEQGSLYRGDEHKSAVVSFIKHKKKCKKIKSAKELDNYCWVNSTHRGIRNTVIGSLLIDLAEGKGLDAAVGAFEQKVAPTNYKRPTALITKSMIASAQKKVHSLGIAEALPRRYACIDDITVNNILWADRSTKQQMDVFDEMADTIPIKTEKLGKVAEVSVDTFIKDILPKADTIELMAENKHINNFMSLVAPIDPDAKSILKWGNNFSWSYNGNVADSMKERVAKAGGNVSGVLRFSIQWNDGDNNQNDFDAHCIEPDGNYIEYGSAGRIHRSSGILDVDIITPGNEVAVENITWSDRKKMQEGIYTVLVHNFSHCGGTTGFTAEIEYDGVIHSYTYEKGLKNKEKVQVAKFTFDKTFGIKFIEALPSSQASKEVWGVPTHTFQEVSVVMQSPNHWDGEKTGNKHYFFMLKNCLNPDTTRGFFNEFLNDSLTEHRKVFEVLGSKMKAPESDTQLSGIGFSSTKRDNVLCKVTGSFSRTIKIKF